MIKSNGKIELTRDEAVTRAYKATEDDGFYYKLGSGGRDPRALRPYTVNADPAKANRVDCSGLVAWVLGYDRFRGYRGGADAGEVWVYTDSIEADGRFKDKPHVSAQHGVEDLFRLVGKDERVLPGDILVYAGKTVNGERKPGHTGVIVDVRPAFLVSRGTADWYKHVKVAHATPSHRKKYGNVVAITDARIWRTKGYIVRYTGFKSDVVEAAIALPAPKKPATETAKALVDIWTDDLLPDLWDLRAPHWGVGPMRVTA